MVSSRSQWRAPRTGNSTGVCTCASCLRAVDVGEDVTCQVCVEQMAEIAYANGRADARGEDGNEH